jgi:signal transduction histidine kinase
MLMDKGHTVESASTFDEGKELLRESTPDLLITDVRLGALNGLQLLVGRGDVEAIVITGYADPVIAAEARRQRALFFAKPFDPDIFLDAIDTLVTCGWDKAVRQLESGALEPHKAIRQAAVRIVDLDKAFLAIVRGFCHDLSNSLSGVSAVLEIADTRDTPTDARTAKIHKEWTHLCLSEFQNAVRMLRDLHQFARRADEASAVDDTEIESISWRREILVMLRPLLTKTTELRIELDVPRRILAIPKVLLRHLLVPLVMNAADALRDVGVGREQTVLVRIKADELNRLLTVSVKDSGSGWGSLRDQVGSAIVNGKSLSTRGKSRGHGLLNVYRIVSCLGGRLELGEASYVQGACVTMIIPWSKNAKA